MPQTPSEANPVPGRDNTMRSAPTALIIPADHWRSLLDHLSDALPAEGCGLLACPEGKQGELRITHVFPGRNVLASPTRFRMDPAEVIAAFRFMREHDLRLAAIFHSHPASPPTLSEIDRLEAHYPDAAILIVSFASSPPQAVAWRLEADSAAEIPIHIGPGQS